MLYLIAEVHSSCDFDPPTWVYLLLDAEMINDLRQRRFLMKEVLSRNPHLDCMMFWCTGLSVTSAEGEEYLPELDAGDVYADIRKQSFCMTKCERPPDDVLMNVDCTKMEIRESGFRLVFGVGEIFCSTSEFEWKDIERLLKRFET